MVFYLWPSASKKNGENWLRRNLLHIYIYIFILGQYKYRNYYAQGIFWEKSEYIIGKVKVLKELNYEARWEIRINQEDNIYQKILR